MPIVMSLKASGVTPDQYDQLRQAVDWEGNPAKGGIFHVAWFDDQGLRAFDVWESEQDWNKFLEQRLGPTIAATGMDAKPEVEISQAHSYFDTAVARGA